MRRFKKQTRKKVTIYNRSNVNKTRVNVRVNIPSTTAQSKPSNMFTGYPQTSIHLPQQAAPDSTVKLLEFFQKNLELKNLNGNSQHTENRLPQVLPSMAPEEESKNSSSSSSSDKTPVVMYTEEDLLGMSNYQLNQLCDQNGLSKPKDRDKKISSILSQQSKTSRGPYKTQPGLSRSTSS